MPRHNYWKISPEIIAMYKKHGMEVPVKKLLPAFGDTLRALARFGDIWFRAYRNQE